MSSCAADEPQTNGSEPSTRRRAPRGSPPNGWAPEGPTPAGTAARSARDAKAERRGGGGEGGCVQRAAEGAGEGVSRLMARVVAVAGLRRSP